MEFDKVTLEGKKYQDLVKIAKEHDVYRRYAPKAEIIERLLDLNKEPSANDENLLSDVSMPSLDISSEDEPADVSQHTLRNRTDNRNKSGIANRKSALREVQIKGRSVQKSRKTVAFVTPERSSPVKGVSSKRIVRVSTPAKPVKTPVVQSAKKNKRATSTPAATHPRTERADHSLENDPETTFTITDESSPIQKEYTRTFKREDTFDLPESGTQTGEFKREGTFEIITVDSNGRKVSEVLTANGEPVSSSDVSWNKSTRSPRSSDTPVQDSETKGPRKVSVKELRLIFETEVEASNKKESPATHSRSSRMSKVSPQLKPKSTRSSMLRASLRKSDVRSASNTSLPSTARKMFVTSRAKPTGYAKPPSTKNLSLSKTPKLKSPSVFQEIQLKQQAVSAKKMLEATSETKSKIPPPRKVPNFGEMHAKIYSKMESVVDAKKKVLNRAHEYGSSAFPRCAVVTPKFFSAEKTQQLPKADRPADSRPVAARQLKLPGKSKIPARTKDATNSSFSIGVLPLSENRKSTSKNVEKPKQSLRTMMPPNCLISRLPVIQSIQTSRRSGNAFKLVNKAPTQIQKMKETIITKAPVKKVQDITSKNRNLLQNVRTNKRFELQMQHRMKSQA